ncbi:MAG: hypothetical protein V4675_11965 [Verrucomicrobiota bacterium]
MDKWPDRLRLFTVLATISKLLEHSPEDGWDLSYPEKLKTEVDQIIDSVFYGGAGGLPEHWWGLFAPTGVLQETSLANGWGEVFLKLAAEFDSLEFLLKQYEAEKIGGGSSVPLCASLQR